MIQIVNCEQGTPEWHAARAGIPTASRFAAVLAEGVKKDAASKTRRAYMLRLAGELLTGEVEESYSNGHMERGKALESEARDLYAFVSSVEPQKDWFMNGVGFILNSNGNAGCSPDSLVGDDGALEIKTALPSILLDKLLSGTFPPEHKAQTQGTLWVAEREWIDLAIYWPKLPLFIVRATRDDAYIATLASAVDVFNAELAETVERIRHYGNPSTLLRKQLTGSLEAVA